MINNDTWVTQMKWGKQIKSKDGIFLVTHKLFVTLFYEPICKGVKDSKANILNGKIEKIRLHIFTVERSEPNFMNPIRFFHWTIASFYLALSLIVIPGSNTNLSRSNT